MKLNIIKKAWKVWVDNDQFNSYPYFRNKEYLRTVYADTISEAKQYCDFEYDSFIEIKAVRSKHEDKIRYNGHAISRSHVMSLIERDKRNNKIKKLNKSKYYYVQDARNYVGNAVLWWGKNSNGYVTDLAKAHVYSYDEIRKGIWRETDIIWPAEHVEKAIRQYVDMQGLDMTKRI